MVHVDSPLDAVQRATNALHVTVDGLTDNAWREPSLLPGWTRAHVIAHVALNAEGLAAAVDSLRAERVLPMYRSDADRAADIEHLAARPGDEIRERVFAASTIWRDAVTELDPDRSGTLIERVPGGPAFPADEVPFMRWREVEIHHADLDADFVPEQWSADFLDHLLPLLVHDRGEEVDLTLRTPRGEFVLGRGSAPGPEISGSAADVAFWLLGRGTGAALEGGPLPRLGAWVRRPRGNR